MSEPIVHKILAYIKSQSRNKIVFYKDAHFGISPIDIGKQLSLSIYNLIDESKLPMKVSLELAMMLNTAITNHSEYGRILAISNIGILLELELKQNFNRILDAYSQNNMLFVQWDGEMDQEYLYFLTKDNGIKIKIKNLSHIVI